MEHIWQFFLNVTGINDSQNAFATHMYNFWSGFGSDLAEFAIIGSVIALYRSHAKQLRLMRIDEMKTKLISKEVDFITKHTRKNKP